VDKQEARDGNGIWSEIEGRGGITSNPDSDGQHRRNGEHEKHTSKRGEYALDDIEPDAMHTDRASEQGEYIGKKRKGEFDGSNSGNGINGFDNFPTQPPICGGDDGIPRELDGVTFSKWRNESIKAYGNAIVPQVALQILKAIAQYESQT
jgi:DNA (cytosine-5)-methyltransferase 1